MSITPIYSNNNPGDCRSCGGGILFAIITRDGKCVVWCDECNTYYEQPDDLKDDRMPVMWTRGLPPERPATEDEIKSAGWDISKFKLNGHNPFSPEWAKHSNFDDYWFEWHEDRGKT